MSQPSEAEPEAESRIVARERVSPAQGIRIRVLVPLCVAMVLLLGAFAVTFVRDARQRRAESIARAAAQVEDLMKSDLNDSIEVMTAISRWVMGDEKIADALRNGDRGELLAICQPILDELRRRNRVTHFYFHRSDRTNLLRVHHPEEFGDKIDRLTLIQAQRTGQRSAGNEQGPFGALTLRVVHPWFSKGELIGYLELGVEFEDVMQRVHDLLHVDVFVAVEKKFLDRAKWDRAQVRSGRNVSWAEFPSVVVLSRTGPIPDSLTPYLASLGSSHGRRAFDFESRGNVHQTITVPFSDVAGRELGDVITVLDISTAAADARHTIVLVVELCATIGGTLLVLFYMLLGRLQRDVAERTARLAETQLTLAEEQGERHRVERERDLHQERIILLETQGRMAHELAIAKEAAEAASRAKSVFLANMSHELRSPLNTVLGFARSIARQHGISPSARSDLQVIARSAEHLRTLINQVLDLSKIEAGRSTLVQSSFDLHLLLDDVEDMFALSAQDKRLQLVLERGADVPQYVIGDQVRLRQVLINLLSNALKFTSEGTVALRVVRLANATSDWDCRLRFTVSDTGPGIAEDELDTLFGLFVQAKAGRQSKEGTGLGLAISRSFVELMHGRIRIESRVGEGTTVIFEIPLRIGRAAPVIVSEEMLRPLSSLAPGQARYRILVVDDRWAARQVLVRLLIPLGFDLREAGNGREAIEIWESWLPHLILMDQRMPVMGGNEAARLIKSKPRGRDTIIVALTAGAIEDDQDHLLAGDCDDVLRKPYDEAELFELLQKHLGVRYVSGHEGAPAAAAKA